MDKPLLELSRLVGKQIAKAIGYALLFASSLTTAILLAFLITLGVIKISAWWILLPLSVCIAVAVVIYIELHPNYDKD